MAWSLVKIIRDSRGVKEPELFNNNKCMIIYVLKDLNFNSTEHERIDSKTVIDFPENLSVFILTKNKKTKRKLTKKKNLYEKTLKLVKTFMIQNGQPIGVLLIKK